MRRSVWALVVGICVLLTGTEAVQAANTNCTSSLSGSITGDVIATATNGRTMPLCKFPEEARFLSSGDVNLAANWSCEATDTRMLRVGSNGTASGADTATALQFLYEPIGLNGQ